jgi:hypothetical protein
MHAPGVKGLLTCFLEVLGVLRGYLNGCIVFLPTCNIPVCSLCSSKCLHRSEADVLLCLAAKTALPQLTECLPATPKLDSKHLVVNTLMAPPKKYCTPRQPM